MSNILKQAWDKRIDSSPKNSNFLITQFFQIDSENS